MTDQKRIKWSVFRSNLLVLFLVACTSAVATDAPTAAPAAQTPAVTVLSTAPAATVAPTIPPAPTATLIAGQYTYDDLIQTFAYNSQAPLNIQEISVSDAGDGIQLHEITYAGFPTDRIEAFLVVPNGEGPFAGVLFMHWGGGSKFSFLNEAIALADHGVVSLLVQGTWNPVADNFKRTVISLRRGADLLGLRTDVDGNRLGYVGHSWGAAFGGILADVDRRFKTYILIAGVPYFSAAGEKTDMIPFDGVRYIGQAAPASLFFQFANQDEGVSREMAMMYYGAASEPKQIEWYDTNHRFNNEEAQQDRLEWLSDELGLP